MNRPLQLLAGASSLLLLLVSLACESPFGPTRVTMFPPDLEYLPPEQLRTTMWVLASEIRYLEVRLNEFSDVDPGYQQAEVRNCLERMKLAASALDESGRTTQHPVLNKNLGQFLLRLERAVRSVDRDPPNYFPASTIAGSCYLCHGAPHESVERRAAPPASVAFTGAFTNGG